MAQIKTKNNMKGEQDEVAQTTIPLSIRLLLQDSGLHSQSAQKLFTVFVFYQVSNALYQKIGESCKDQSANQGDGFVQAL
jgi:hypothetical protein